MADEGDFVTDYHLAIEPLAALGWDVATVPWRAAVDWDSFDAVYIAAPWDYPQHAAAFLDVLTRIETSTAMLINPLTLVRWNLDKRYLGELEARGVAIVPTRFRSRFVVDDIVGLFRELDTDRIVIKPAIGGNAVDTFVLRLPVSAAEWQRYARLFAGRDFLVQPFIDAITDDGEYSLFFMNGEYSHAIRKLPGPGDFRVQEEHGADIQAVQADDELLRTAAAVFAGVDPVPVYGRGDWVRGDDGRYWLMELELIEPSLYLRTDRHAPARFARAVQQRFEEFAGK